MKNMFSKSGKNDASQDDKAETLKSLPESRRKTRFNLRIKLPVVAISLLALAFLGLTIISVSVSRLTLMKTLESNLQTEASLQAESIRSHLTWTRSMAIDLSTVAASMNLDEEESKQVIAHMLSQNEQVVGSAIAYEPYRFKPDVLYWAPYYNRTASGSLQFTQLGTPENNYPSQDWYNLAKEANGIILSPPYFDTGGAKIWMVTWSVPFHDASGKLKGVATTDIAFSQTQDIVRQIAVGKYGYAFLIDKDGVILGIGDQGGQYNIMEDHLMIPNPSEQESSWNNVIKQMIAGQSGFANVIDPQGNSMFVEYQPIGMNTGWSLGLAYPQKELFQPAVQLQNNLILLSVIVLVVASVALFLFSLSITRPLREIATWASSVSQRDDSPSFDEVVSPLNIHTNDEIEDLAETFNQMRQELRQAFSTLEQRVAERTQALTTVAEVSTTASTILETDRLLQQVVDLAKERFAFYHAHIYLLNEAGDTLVLASGAGKVGRQMVAEGRSIPLDREQSLVARAAREKKGVTVNDVTQTPDFLPNPLLPDTHSEMAVPMMIGEHVIGVLDVQSEVVGRFTEADVAVQTTLASQIATAIQNSRSFAEIQRSQAQLAEALTISRLGNWEYDVDKDIFTFNDQFYSIFRTTAEKVGGYKLSSAEYSRNFVHPDDAALVGAEIGKALEAKERYYRATLEHRILFENGETGYISVNVNVERDENGKIIRWYGANQDITERRHLEELIRKRAVEQEAINLITQKIQSAITVEEALQVAAREVGHVLGGRETIVAIEPPALTMDGNEN
ncbi:MAG: GAF domain-containing protein [Chloroflexi bacterium]|nr:GAF domain-containing protein [Chloroflexota bacterium]